MQEMTLDQMKARVAELLANEDRQPKDDQELEELQRQVGLMATAQAAEATVSPSTDSTGGNMVQEPTMEQVKAKAVEKGVMYKIGMTKAYLLKKIEEVEQAFK